MENSAIDKKLLQYFTQLNHQQKKSLLELIETFLNTSTQTINAITIEEYNNELQEAEIEFERGEYITHEELLKQIEQWNKDSMR
jgi:hypothetical protein